MTTLLTSTFAIESQSNILNNMTCYEPVNLDILNKLLQSDLLIQWTMKKKELEHVIGNEEKQLQNYKSLVNKKTKLAKVSYNRVKGMSYGRSNPDKGLGLFQIRKMVRDTVLHDMGMIDQDIDNCHPQLLYQKCKQIKNINCVKLEHYINNRDDVFNQIMTDIPRFNKKTKEDRKIVKNLFIRILYFGKLQFWCQDFNINLQDVPQWLVDYCTLFENEVKIIGNLIAEANPEICREVEKNKELHKQEFYNKTGSVVSFYLQELEIRILEVIYKFCCDKGYIVNNVCVLAADGIMLEKKNLPEEFLQIIPFEFNKIVLEKTGFNLNFSNKLLDEDCSDIIDEHLLEDKDIDTFCDNDNEAGDEILERLKDVLIYCNGQYFLKTDRIWLVNDKDKIDSYLLIYIMNSKIYKMHNGNKQDYVQNITCAKKVLDTLRCKLINTSTIDIYSKFHTTTKDRICFQDGVLDFKERKFYTWEDVNFEYYTTIMIQRKYKSYFENPDRTAINDIKDKIFQNLFDNDTTKALQFLSRCITANVKDKDWASYLGRRDCGKGVLFQILKTAFCDYISAFELENILYVRESHKSGDASKELYWLIDLQFVRLAISQEIPKKETGKKVKSKLFKSMVGGGDELIARRNFDRVDTHFTIDTSFFIMGNDDLIVDTKDCNEHRHEFKSVNSFKSQAEINTMRELGENELVIQSYKVQDPLIKDVKCLTEEWGNAMVYLLYESYITHAIPIIHDVDDVVISVRSIILEKYEITKHYNDVCRVIDVVCLLGECKKKITNELLSMGCTKSKSKTNTYRDQLCFYGLKLREIEPDEQTDCESI